MKLKLSLLGGLCIGLAFSPSTQASILTFSDCGTSTTGALSNPAGCNGSNINPIYGDRVTGANTDAGGTEDRSYGEAGEGYTPNVVSTISNAFGWGTGFGLLTNVIYVDGIAGQLTVRFDADPGFRVRLHGFDLGAFLPPVNGYNPVVVTVTNEANAILFTDTYAVGSSGVNEEFGVLLVQSGNGGSLTLSLDTSGLAFDTNAFIFDRESVGIDNIRFSQSAATEPPPSGDIPEPSTFALVGGAALLAAYARRR